MSILTTLLRNMKNVDGLLHDVTDPVTQLEWKIIQMENSYNIYFVAQDVSAADYNNKCSQKYPIFVKPQINRHKLLRYHGV